MKKILFLSFLFSCFLHGKSQTSNNKKYDIQKNEKSLLWEVTGKSLKKPSFLYGTFHLMCKNDLVFSENLKAALSQSDVLMLELDMDDPKIAMGGLMSLAMKENKKLRDLLSETEFNKVSDYFRDSLNTPLFFLESVQPMLLQSLLYSKLIPCSQMTSPEQELMKLIKSKRKPVEGLETLEFQASVFEKIPYQVQAKMLLKSIDSIEFQRLSFLEMLETYKSQDLDKLNSIASNEIEMKSFEDALLNDRNKNWVQKMAVSMPEKSFFFAVGAGHLPGESGIIALLRNQGFTVRPIVNLN
jgi:uncharacterized protein YbaP (TraB family)